MNSPYPSITVEEAERRMTEYMRDRDDPSIPSYVMAKAWFGVLAQRDAVVARLEVTTEAIDVEVAARMLAEIVRLQKMEQRVIEWRRKSAEAAKDDPDDWEARLAYEIHTGERATYYDPAWEDAMRHSYNG